MDYGIDNNDNDNNDNDDDNDDDNIMKDDNNNDKNGRTTIESDGTQATTSSSSSSSSSSLVIDSDENKVVDVDDNNVTEEQSESQPTLLQQPYPAPFDSTVPPVDLRQLTLKNLDTGEEFLIGENDPDFEWDTFEIDERRTEERLSHENPNASWLSYLYSLFYTQIDGKSDKEKSTPKRTRTPFTKLSSFKMRRELGRGAFGRVLLAEAKIDNKLYALKIISKQSIRTNADKTQAKAERDIMHAMTYSNPHPFTSGLKFAFQSENNLYLGMDFLPGGNLRELIKRHKVLPEKWVIQYSAELVLALAHLHSINVLYRDIKPHNVMIDGKGHIIIIDFGLSKWDRENYKNKDRAMSLVGTPDYSAPEVLRTGVYQIEKKRQSVNYNAKSGYRNRNKKPKDSDDENYGYGKAADWWSLGIMIYEMLSGTPTFRGADLRQTYQKVLFSELEFKPIELFSEPSKALLLGLLDRNTETRLGSGKNSPQDIKNAEFFKGIDWDRVLSRIDDGPWIPEPVVFRRRSSQETTGEIKNIQNELNNENVAQNDVQSNQQDEEDMREPIRTGSESNATMHMRESIFSTSMTNNGNKLQGWSFFDEQALAGILRKNNEEEQRIQQLLL